MPASARPWLVSYSWGLALALGLSFVLSVCVEGPQAAVYEGTPATYGQVLRRLRPGDTLRLVGGVYRRGLLIHFLNGAPDAPIVVEGPARGAKAIFRGPDSSNTVSIVNSRYVELRYLVLDGRGGIGDAVKAEGFSACDWAHHITLDGLLIRGYGGNQQRVGISTKCPAWDWVIRNNVIIGAGTGIYLGNSDGNAPFFRGLIENNLIADTIGYNLQIKHQRTRPDDIPDVPAGEGRTIIRRNVFSKAEGASSGGMARPNVLVGHWPYSGPERKDEYLIYGNLFYQNPHEALFQGEGNIALYDNLFVNHYESGFPAIAIQPHNWVLRRISIFHNTVVARGKGIVIRSRAPGDCQQVVANAVFADTPLAGGQQRANVGKPYQSAALFLNAPFAELSEIDLYPREGKLEGEGISLEDLARFIDSHKDYNGRERNGRFVGAYAGEGDNPGPLPGLGHGSETGAGYRP